MIFCSVDPATRIATVRVSGPLTREDFAHVAGTIDPVIAGPRGLTGLMIEADGFPGYRGVGAMIDHFNFIMDRHKSVGRIAFITASKIAAVAEWMSSVAVKAEMRVFGPDAIAEAKAWLLGETTAGAPA